MITEIVSQFVYRPEYPRGLVWHVSDGYTASVFRFDDGYGLIMPTSG